MEKHNRRKFIKKTIKAGLYAGSFTSGMVALNGCQDTFSKGYYKVDDTKCTGTQTCIKYCGYSAITMQNGKAVINESRCTACGHCVRPCPTNAIYYVSG